MSPCRFILKVMMLQLGSPSISDHWECREFRELWKVLDRERNLGGNQEETLVNYFEIPRVKWTGIAKAPTMIHSK